MRLDVNPATICADNVIIYKIARRASALRAADDAQITIEKLTDTLSQEREEEKQFVDNLENEDHNKLVQMVKQSSARYSKLNHRKRLQAFIGV